MKRFGALPTGLALVLLTLATSGCFGGEEASARGRCDWLADLPGAFEHDDGATTTYWARDGCTFSMARIETRSGDLFARSVTFTPPVLLLDYSGSLVPDGAGTPSTGTVGYESVLNAENQTFSTRGNGSYSAEASVRPIAWTGELLRQWAESATGSEGPDSGAGGEGQAVGRPDVWTADYDDNGWRTENGSAHAATLELRYGTPVIPVAIEVYEAQMPGAVAQVEAYDTEADTWVAVWGGQDPIVESPAALRLDPSRLTAPTDRLRVTLNTRPDETHGVDAVALIGAQGWILRLEGTWRIHGAFESCGPSGCESPPSSDGDAACGPNPCGPDPAATASPSGSWSFAMDSSRGWLGESLFEEADA